MANESWILCFQTPYDRVKFSTSEIETFQLMKYQAFLKYIQGTYHLDDYVGFKKALDTFKDILVICEERRWMEYVDEGYTTSRKILLSVQEKEKPRESTREARQKRTLNSVKELVTGMFKKKQKELRGQYNDQRPGAS